MNSTAEMLNALSSIIGQAESLQAMVRAAHGAVIDLKEKSKKEKVPKEDRPKREMSDGMKAWHEFNRRLDALMKEGGQTFKRVAEAKKFASHLKKLKAPEEWAAVEIMEEREKWVEPVADTTVTEVSSDESTTETKNAGRPKMTDEEKAAAKAKREAMTDEEKAEAKAKRDAKKAAKAAKTDIIAPEVEAAPEVTETPRSVTPKKTPKIGAAPGAPKKEAKVAWAADTEDVTKKLLEEIDEHIAE
jgi:colicin import membrane protein